MRPLRVALAACALLAAPLALSAQQPVVQPIAPGQPAHPPHPPPNHPPPNHHPHPYPTGGHGYRPPYAYGGQRYPYVTIDAGRYLATPTPKPAAKHTHSPHPNGQDVFETHSSDDAK